MKPTGSGVLIAGVIALLSFATACAPGTPDTAEPAPAGPTTTEPVGPQVRTDSVPGRPDVAPGALRMRGVDPDTVTPGRFDQGRMWTFEYPPVEYFRETYGAGFDTTWFRHARLSALRIPSCSASFVSPHGLVMTNHHCARDFVTQVSGEGEDLLEEGFFARSLEEERPVEDFEADQLVEIVDITEEVEARTRGLSGPNLVEARDAVLEEIAERMQEERGGEDAGWVVESISLYNGARASAYVFRRYTNVRLVMAPELDLGFFGGDPDNFTYPRYALDAAFFRVYDDAGDPLDTSDHFFRFDDMGIEAGDAVFVVGNPGSTSRLQTVAQLEFRRDVSDRAILRFVRSRADVFENFIEAYPDLAEEHDLRNVLFGLRNQEKAMQGQLAGLEDPDILARRRAAQRQLLDSIRARQALREEYGGLIDEMAAIQRELREVAPAYGAFLALTVGEYASPTLHRALLAFQILNGQRGGASPEQLADLVDELRAVGDRPAALDEALIEARIEDFIRSYGRDSELVERVLQGRSPEGAAAVIREGSVLSDSAAAVQAVERGRLDPSDPALQFVQAYLPELGAFQSAISGPGQRERDVARRLGRARFEIYGTRQPPDATFSLRIADGVVRGYEYNGTVAPTHTTYYGLYDHFYSYRNSYQPPDESPWDLPERWLQPPATFDLATPLNFVSTADIIGGNSGSPVVNRDLEVVGVVFDGNIESLPSDYIYLTEANRAVAVDSRGIVEALDDLYDLDRLVVELVQGALAETEAEADEIRR